MLGMQIFDLVLVSIGQPEEVDILGLDGHIYKGRLKTRSVKTVDARLPTIFPKDGTGFWTGIIFSSTLQYCVFLE